MSEPVRIAIPAAVAAFVRPDSPLQERLRAARGDVELPPRELLLLLFCLCKDREQEVRNAAELTLRELHDEQFDCLTSWPDLHPAVVHTLAHICGIRPYVRHLLFAHPALAEVTASFLRAIGEQQSMVQHELPLQQAETLEGSDPQTEPTVEQDLAEEDEPALDAEDSEEYLSKYKLAQVMGIGEKIKMALTGDKEWRKILIKDANKLVSSGVMKNPRITEPEVLTILKSGVQNDEIMRLICANKEWVKNYQIRKALIENPKTPLASALRFLGTMNEKDVSGYAKSRNISSVLATQAKRMLLNKKRG